MYVAETYKLLLMSRMQRLYRTIRLKMRTSFPEAVATRMQGRMHSLATGRPPLQLQRGAAHTQSTLSSTAGESPFGPGSADGDILRAHQRHDPRQHVYGARCFLFLFLARGPLSLFFSIFTPCRFLLRHAADVSLATRVTSGHAWICTLSLAAVSSQTHCMYVGQPPLIHARDARGRGRRRRRESSMRAATTSGCHRRHPIHAPLPLS